MFRNFSIGGGDGEGEEESGAAGGQGLRPDAPAVALDDLLAEGEADAAARDLGVETFEDREHRLGLGRGEPAAVVAHGEDPFAGAPLGRDVHAGGLAAAEFDRIAEKILKNLSNL